MNIVNQEVKKISIKQNQGHLIEYCGRICYQSRNKIGENSWEEFVTKCVSNKHFSVLEFGWTIIDKPKEKKYLKPVLKYGAELENNKILINYRTYFETVGEYNLDRLIKELKTNNGEWIDKIDPKYVPVIIEIKTNRAILAQLTRHRVFSFMVESQRFCRYERLNYIIPKELKKEVEFLKTLERIECVYKKLNLDYPAQISRMILPQAVETNLVMASYYENWQDFFTKRSVANVDPMMKELVEKIKEVIEM